MDTAPPLDDLAMLVTLQRKLFNDLLENPGKFRIAEFLRLIDMKRKIMITGKSEKELWTAINQAREKRLAAKGPGGKYRRTKKTAAETLATENAAKETVSDE